MSAIQNLYKVSGWDTGTITVCGQEYEAVAVSAFRRGGHYVTSLRGNENQWVLINDAIVSPSPYAEQFATLVVLKRMDVARIPCVVKLV